MCLTAKFRCIYLLDIHRHFVAVVTSNLTEQIIYDSDHLVSICIIHITMQALCCDWLNRFPEGSKISHIQRFAPWEVKYGI